MLNTNLRIGGLATGMDTDSIVRDLMKIQRVPLDKKVKEKQVWQWKQEDYRSLNTTLLSLKNKAFDMRLESPYTAKTVTSGNQQIVTATAIGSANNGTYDLKVTQLATSATNISSAEVSADPNNKISTSASLISQASKFANPGDFFNGMSEGNMFTVSVRISATKTKDFTFSYADSLDSIINTINSDKEAGISVFYDSGTDKVVASSKTTGSSASVEITGDLFTTVLRLDNPSTPGKDSEFYLNGLKTGRSTNNFTINGVTFNLKGLTPSGVDGAYTTVLVETDVDAVYNNIKSFVDKYNEVYDVLNSKLTEEYFRDYQPLTDEEKEALSESEVEKWEKKARSGLLKNDQLLSSALNEMRRVMASVVQGVSGATSLSAIGINTGSYWDNDKGKLKIDETKLKEAIQNDPKGVNELFSKDSTVSSQKGIVRQLYDAADAAIKRITTQAGAGTKLVDDSFIGRTVKDINKRIAALETRLEQVENRYWRQFTAMERAISSMNQQSSWLTAQLGGGQSGQ